MMILSVITALSDRGQRAVVRRPGRGCMARIERAAAQPAPRAVRR
jgi:hypothetical protein